MKYWNKLLFEIKNNHCTEFDAKNIQICTWEALLLGYLPFVPVGDISGNIILTRGDVDDCDNGDGHDENLSNNKGDCIAI